MLLEVTYHLYEKENDLLTSYIGNLVQFSVGTKAKAVFHFCKNTILKPQIGKITMDQNDHLHHNSRAGL